MKTLEEVVNINEGNKSSSEKLYDLFVKEMNSVDWDSDNVQDTMKFFLKKCFDETPHKDAHIAIGDAIFEIYEDYVK